MIVALFFALVRASVWLHTSYDLNPWIALLGGAFIAALVLLITIASIHKWVLGRFATFRSMKWIGFFAVGLVVSFCTYSVIYLSDANAKATDVQSEFRSMHPVLRLAVSTVILGDKQLLITDAQRSPEDYAKMGLSPLASSKHYPQADGYVYAVDIRTIGRGEERNDILKGVFEVLGFKTLRHVGTADHLHIELPMYTQKPLTNRRD